MTTTLDVRSLPCPGPVIELRKLLDSGVTAVDLHVADELARSNVSRFAATRGAQVTTEPHQGGFLVGIRAPAGADAPLPSPAVEPPPGCAAPVAGPRVVQITADTMGSGDAELGALLLRGFLKTLDKVEPLPDTVVLYNAGVKLCCEGSPALDALRALADAGTTVVACGTCLSFYGLADTLAVGRVTDMLEIVTILGGAGSVDRP